MYTAFILLLLTRAFVNADGWEKITSDLQTDQVQSGNYAISLCGAGQPGSQASKLQNLLPYTWHNIQNLLADSELGTASTHGFRSIFKSNENRPYVQSVFQAIAQGRDIPRNTGKPSDLFHSPTIICANLESETSTSTLFYDHFCVDDIVFRRTYTTAASYQPDTNFVILCPPFWALPLGLTDDACPDVVGSRRRRRLFPNNDSLLRSKYSALLHELVHLYNPFEPAANDGWEEKYRIQDLVDLDAKESLINAQNYAAYAAAVQAGCTMFPDPPSVKEELRS